MKKRKKILSLALVSTLMVGSVVSASGSGYKDALDITAGTYRVCPSYKCYSSAPTALGSNTYTYFQNASTLANNFANDSGRRLIVELWDDDGLSEDDKIKIYTSKFSGRTPSFIFDIKPIDSGAIDSDGDDCAELYIKFSVDKVSGDPSSPKIGSGLFQYSVGVN